MFIKQDLRLFVKHRVVVFIFVKTLEVAHILADLGVSVLKIGGFLHSWQLLRLPIVVHISDLVLRCLSDWNIVMTLRFLLFHVIVSSNIDWLVFLALLVSNWSSTILLLPFELGTSLRLFRARARGRERHYFTRPALTISVDSSILLLLVISVLHMVLVVHMDLAPRLIRSVLVSHHFSVVGWTGISHRDVALARHLVSDRCRSRLARVMVTRLRNVTFVLVTMLWSLLVRLVKRFLLHHSQPFVQRILTMSGNVLVDLRLINISRLKSLNLGLLAVTSEHLLSLCFLTPPLRVHHTVNNRLGSGILACFVWVVYLVAFAGAGAAVAGAVWAPVHQGLAGVASAPVAWRLRVNLHLVLLVNGHRRARRLWGWLVL